MNKNIISRGWMRGFRTARVRPGLKPLVGWLAGWLLVGALVSSLLPAAATSSGTAERHGTTGCLSTAGRVQDNPALAWTDPAPANSDIFWAGKPLDVQIKSSADTKPDGATTSPPRPEESAGDLKLCATISSGVAAGVRQADQQEAPLPLPLALVSSAGGMPVYRIQLDAPGLRGFRRSAEVSVEIRSTSPGNPQSIAQLNQQIRFTDQRACAIYAIGFVATIYLLMALGLRAFYSRTKPAGATSKGSFAATLNPVALTAAPYGSASLSNLQLLWFTLIITGLSAYYWLLTGALAEFSQGILWLLGISSATKVAASSLTAFKQRLSLESWNWLVVNGYLNQEDSIDPATTAQWRDLVMDGSTLDPTRYQLALFSFLLGVNLIFGDATRVLTGFTVPAFFNSLQGASSVLYVLGRVVNPSALNDLEQKVTALRAKGRTSATTPRKAADPSQARQSPVSPDDFEFLKNSIEALYGKAAWAGDQLERIKPAAQEQPPT